MTASSHAPSPEDPAPVLTSLPLDLGIRPNGGRKLVAPIPGTRRIDDQAAVLTLLAWLDRRIQRPAQRATHDVHVSLGIRAGTNRPDDLVEIGDIDIVIHDDD